MIPDDNPGLGEFLTLKDIERLLRDVYGRETDNRLDDEEVEEIIATLKDGYSVFLHEVNMLIQEEGTGLYCFYEKRNF